MRGTHAMLNQVMNRIKNGFNNKADNLSEMLLALDENGVSTGQYFDRGFIHDNNIWHNGIALWILNPKTQEILLQRRHPSKKAGPGKLGICAGHVVGEETIEQARDKESIEEMGIDPSKYDCKPFMVVKRQDLNNYCFTHHFYIMAEIPLSKFVIQQSELLELVYMNYNVVREKIKNGDSEIAVKWSPQMEEIFAKIDELFASENILTQDPPVLVT